MSDEARLRRIADSYVSKYGGGWRFAVRDGAFYHDPGSLRGTDTGEALVYEVASCTIFGFGKSELFSQTRWRFQPELAAHLPPRGRAHKRKESP